ncbi:hypothetical protein O3M35_010225 [Rhynocoris fuscipes]|uniref:DRBM domain-containing protein n=1 Tax=Rhynocoris fuscipes TaxID=488301 RepID=A0AAW1D579_9HEMI
MSFSKQEEVQIISKKLLNPQNGQSFSKFERELSFENQYPCFTHQLHSYRSPYLSVLNINGRDYKLHRSIQKRKRNFYLKTVVQYPKSASNLLKEVYPELKIKVTKQLYGTQESYTSEINIDGYEFSVTDYTKEKTIESACEEVIKTIFFGKVFDEEDIEMDTSTAVLVYPDMKTKEENQSWSLLARYAIFKLFSEWNKPSVKEEFHPPKLSEVRSVLGIVNKKHPVQLLHEIRPNWRFIEERYGISSNSPFKASIMTDDKIFTGTGRSKKLARKDCAENVLKALGVNYLWG